MTAVVLAGGADRRGPIRQVQQLDAFFIPLYVALLGVTTGIAARNRRRAGRVVAGVAVALFVSAGVFDHRENGAIESLLASLDWAVGSALPSASVGDAVLQALQVSDLPARVVREASIKWTLLLLGGGLLGFLLLARPYREAWPRRFVALAGLVLLFGAAVGTGLWVDPRTVDPASWCLVAGTLVLFVVAVRASDALQDPEATDDTGSRPGAP